MWRKYRHPAFGLLCKPCDNPPATFWLLYPCVVRALVSAALDFTAPLCSSPSSSLTISTYRRVTGNPRPSTLFTSTSATDPPSFGRRNVRAKDVTTLQKCHDAHQPRHVVPSWPSPWWNGTNRQSIHYDSGCMGNVEAGFSKAVSICRKSTKIRQHVFQSVEIVLKFYIFQGADIALAETYVVWFLLAIFAPNKTPETAINIIII